jgi:serine/threonine protein kinase
MDAPFNASGALGRYRVVDRVGRGGMGVVYRAVDSVLEREVALKLMSDEIVADEDARTRFLREARAAARLQHRHIVTVFEFGESDGRPYIVMEFLRGESLSARLKSDRQLPIAAQLEVVQELCAGLQFAHTQGVIHRDVKPANIWLQEDGSVKLVDFGVARLAVGTATRNEIVGSAPYMAPEVLSGVRADARADVFATGVVLFEMLCGCRPFQGETPTALIAAILNTPTPDITLPGEFGARANRIVKRALAKDPAQRYPSAAALATDIQILQRVQPSAVESMVLLRTPRPALPAQPQRRSKAPLFAGLGAALLLIVGGIVAYPMLFGSQPPASTTAPTEQKSIAAPPEKSAPAGKADAPQPPVDTPPPPPPVVQSVEITSQPEGAAISIGGTATELVTPARVNLDRIQNRPLRLTKQGFDPVTLNIGAAQIEAGTASAVLRPLARITVQIQGPFPFEVVDGRTVRPAAESHNVQIAGRRTLILRARAPWFVEREAVIDPKNGLSQSIDLEVGLLTIRGLQDCELYVDGVKLDAYPFQAKRFVTGPHTIRYNSCPDGGRGTETIEVPAGNRPFVWVRQ